MAAEQGIRASFLRTLGFIKREVAGVFRQPRLIGTLIVAPFAILLVFGVGYRADPPPLATLMVLPSEDASLGAGDVELDDAFGDSIDLVGTTSDVSSARSQLRSGEVDLLIIAPADAISSLEQGEKAEFVVVHSEVNPTIQGSIALLSQLSINELNRQVLTEVVGEAQSRSGAVEQPLEALQQETDALVTALEGGDTAAADQARTTITQTIDDLEDQTSTSNALFTQVSNALGLESNDPFDRLRTSIEATESGDSLDAARQFQEDLAQIEDTFSLLRETDPDLVVRPFTVDIQEIAILPSTPALYYAPGALIVLIQHLAITFASLSLVRERQLGLTELFRVSPLNASEILIGKFVAFVIIAGTVAATLTAAMLAFGITLRGNSWYFVLTVLMAIVASLGLGFVLSVVAETDSQAVQYTMMVLLISIFFTGFIIPLEQLIDPVKVVSFLIPATYGIAALQDMMFRGLIPSPLIIGGLGLYCVAMVSASWFVMRSHVRTTRV